MHCSFTVRSTSFFEVLSCRRFDQKPVLLHCNLQYPLSACCVGFILPEAKSNGVFITAAATTHHGCTIKSFGQLAEIRTEVVRIMIRKNSHWTDLINDPEGMNFVKLPML